MDVEVAVRAARSFIVFFSNQFYFYKGLPASNTK